MASPRAPSSLSAHLQDSLHALDSAMAEAAKQVATVRGVFSEVLAALTEMEALDEALSRARGHTGAQRNIRPEFRARLAEAAQPTPMHQPQASPAPAVASSESEVPLVLRIYAATNRGRLDPGLVEEALTRCYRVVEVKLEELDSRKAEWTVRLDSAKEPLAAKSLLRLAVERLVANGHLAEARVESGTDEAESAVA